MKEKSFTISLPEEMKKHLESFAEKTGISVSEIIQRALKEFFLQEERKARMKEFLDKLTGEKDEELTKIWDDYQEEERKEERSLAL